MANQNSNSVSIDINLNIHSSQVRFVQARQDVSFGVARGRVRAAMRNFLLDMLRETAATVVCNDDGSVTLVAAEDSVSYIEEEVANGTIVPIFRSEEGEGE